jgi:Peptide N-acetyl-beta-D-glucosaminyl asparaginase amidase A
LLKLPLNSFATAGFRREHRSTQHLENSTQESPVKNASPKHVATFIFVFVLLSTLALAQTIGSSNTATADPPVPHPNTTPCKVVLFTHYKFANFNPQSFPYTPPAACPAPWAKVILEANFSVTRGIQYDRTANIWLGANNIYFGTTSEPDPSDARNWHVERDLTDYSSIFTVAQTGNVDLGNIYNKQYNGLLQGEATVYFYPLAANQTAPVTADQVIGFSSGAPGSVGTVSLDTTGQCCQPQFAETLTFPTNIESMYLDVFAQSQIDDEFWYFCVPTNLAGELESCPNTAFRESEITIDGTPAGVAPVYPWIFTGGIDPLLWIPIPGVQTLNFKPYRVNLTPFSAMLDDGNPHTITLSVVNADSWFSVTASLLLYLDHGSSTVTGAVTENTLTFGSPVIKENLQTSKSGTVHGTVNTSSTHNFQISGYVNTSAGSITTTVAQDINFSNDQTFRVNATTDEQNLRQNTSIHSTVTTIDKAGRSVDTITYGWPLTLNYDFVFNSNSTETQITSINQYYERDEQRTVNGEVQYFSVEQNRLTPADTLFLNSSFQITGNEDQSSAQTYFASDSTGYCYNRSLEAANNVLTAITNGVGCN